MKKYISVTKIVHPATWLSKVREPFENPPLSDLNFRRSVSVLCQTSDNNNPKRYHILCDHFSIKPRSSK